MKRVQACQDVARGGITLVEMLVALAVMGALVLLAVGAVSTGARVYRLSDRIVAASETDAAARALMSYDLGLAGYRCVDAGATTRSFGADGPLSVAENEDDGSRGEVIGIRYFEDRDELGCTLVVVTYIIGSETGTPGGRVGLVRTEAVGGGLTPSRALVTEAYSSLGIFRYYSGSGESTVERKDDVGAVSVELGLESGGGRRFIVSTPNLVSYVPHPWD